MFISIIILSLIPLLPYLPTKSGSSHACSACKYQRRKCTEDCALAPYFPGDQPDKFHRAHHLYGVRNMTCILNKVRDDHKNDAMASIIYESNMRARFPVHGCLGIIHTLEAQLVLASEELRQVRARLETCREQGVCPVTENNVVSDQPNSLQRHDDHNFLFDDSANVDPVNQLNVIGNEFKQSPLDSCPLSIGKYVSRSVSHEDPDSPSRFLALRTTPEWPS